MGRHEEPIDPAAEPPLADFARDLRALRRGAGSPSYRQLARLAHFSPSALSTACSGKSLPSWNVTRAFVEACGGDVDDWQRRWQQLASADKLPNLRGQAMATAGRTVPSPAREDLVEQTTSEGDTEERNTTRALVADHADARSGRRPLRKMPKRWVITVLVTSALAVLFTDMLSARGKETGAGSGPTATRALTPSAAAPGQATSLATSAAPTYSPATSADKKANTWSAVHGLGCPGEWSYADLGWKRTGGGWTQDGCDGTARFLQVTPELGRATQLVNFYFDTQPGAKCTIKAFIAEDDRSAGTAFYYLDDDDTTAPHLGGPVTINQKAHRGTWVDLGTWPVPGPGRLVLVLVNQPDKAGATYTVTASAARATCRWRDE